MLPALLIAATSVALVTAAGNETNGFVGRRRSD